MLGFYSAEEFAFSCTRALECVCLCGVYGAVGGCAVCLAEKQVYPGVYGMLPWLDVQCV